MKIRDLWYSIFNKEDYLTYKTGQTPIIITAPHGGNMRPISIPNRRYGKTARDSYTRTLTNMIVDGFEKKPFFVISDIHRMKVDLNRDFLEAAQGDELAGKVWGKWHSTVLGYKRNVLSVWKKGLLIDIHSNSKSDALQLGYGISAKDYNRALAGEKVTGTTLDSLRLPLREILDGEASIKRSIEYCDLPVYTPNDDEAYYNGGRTIEEYSGEGLGAIQIEVPIKLLKKDIEPIAVAIRYAIDRFSETYLK